MKPQLTSTISSHLNSLLYKILPHSSKLSRWAQNNPISAKVIITFCHIFATLNALFLGTLLYLSDWGESKLLVALSCMLFLVCYMNYPNKDQLKFAYVKQKLLDFSFVILYIAFIALSTNNVLNESQYDKTTSINTSPKALFVASNSRLENRPPEGKNIKTFVKDKFQRFKNNLRDLKRQKNKKGAKKGLLILSFILALAGACVLAGAIAGLSCLLFCNGQVGGAVILLVLGGIAVTALFLFAFKGLRPKIKPEREQKKQEHRAKKHKRRHR